MTAQRNHYEVLGVSPTANTDQIKTKYRELARKFHPDVVKDKVLGQKVFTQINQAYRVLADPERRAEYDAGLRANVASAAGRPVDNGARPAGSAVANGANGTMPSAAGYNGNGTANGKGPSAPASAGLSPQQVSSISRFISDADFALLNGDAAAALIFCQNALRIDPKNARVYSLLGESLEHLGRKTEAAAAYRQSLETAPSAIVQSKLNRLMSGGSAPSVPPVGAPRVEKTLTGQRNGTASPATKSAPASGGLFGRLLGKKK